MARIALPPVMPITALSGQWEERRFAWTRAHREIEAVPAAPVIIEWMRGA